MGKYLNEQLSAGERIGQIGVNKDGDKMEIIEYYAHDNIVVEFKDGNGCQVHTQYINFLTGAVKNYNKVVHGEHGYIGQGPYVSEHKENGKRIIHNEYRVWTSMHDRAGNFDGKHPSYADVTVAKEWWNYQNFAKWYNERRYELKDDFLCIDKDILCPEARMYSPETCVLIPNTINEVFKNFDNYKRNNNEGLPNGVQRRSDSKSIRYRSEARYLDEYGNKVAKRRTFDNVFDAFCYYKEAKEKYIKQLAEKYKEVIDPRVYNKLMNYELTTDCDFSKFV